MGDVDLNRVHVALERCGAIGIGIGVEQMAASVLPSANAPAPASPAHLTLMNMTFSTRQPLRMRKPYIRYLSNTNSGSGLQRRETKVVARAGVEPSPLENSHWAGAFDYAGSYFTCLDGFESPESYASP